MAYGDPYYQSASNGIDQDKAALLDAVAKGGAAGKAAFEAAQSAVSSQKQDAAARAATRSALTGIESAPDLGSYDARLGQIAQNQAGNEAFLQGVGASGQSYMEKARAAIPVIQALGANKAAGDEAVIKGALALAQQKADAAAAAAAADAAARASTSKATTPKATPPKASDILNVAQNVGALYGDSTLGGTVGPNGRTVTGSATIPAGRTDVTDQMEMEAQDRAAFNHTDPDFELAKIVAEAYGLSPQQAAELITPGSVAKATTTAQKNIADLTPQEKDTYATALAQKYATKGVTPALARSAVNGQDFQTFVNWINSGAGGATQAEAIDKIRRFFINGEGRSGGNPGPWNAEYQILLGEYVPQLPKS